MYIYLFIYFHQWFGGTNTWFMWDYIQFSKATGRIKELISALPFATKEDDVDEATAFKDETTKESSSDGHKNDELPQATLNDLEVEEPDPFGLDALISKKEDKPKGSKDSLSNSKKDDEQENMISLKSQREALITCLEIAAKRYNMPWLNITSQVLINHLLMIIMLSDFSVIMCWKCAAL